LVTLRVDHGLIQGKLVVETGHWFSGKEIMISPKDIKRISYKDSKVFVNLT